MLGTFLDTLRALGNVTHVGRELQGTSKNFAILEDMPCAIAMVDYLKQNGHSHIIAMSLRDGSVKDSLDVFNVWFIRNGGQ